MDARVRMKNMLMYMHSCHLNSCEMYWREAMRITRERAWAPGNRYCPWSRTRIHRSSSKGKLHSVVAFSFSHGHRSTIQNQKWCVVVMIFCLPVSRRRRRAQTRSERGWSGWGAGWSAAARTRSAGPMASQPNRPRSPSASRLRRRLTELSRAPALCQQLTEAATSN